MTRAGRTPAAPGGLAGSNPTQPTRLRTAGKRRPRRLRKAVDTQFNSAGRPPSFRAWRNWHTHCAQNAAGAKPYGGSNPSARTSSKGAVLLDCAWENVRADAGTGIQAALRAPCASVRVRIPVGTPQFARVVKLAATAVLNTAAFGRGSSSLLSRTGLWRCVRNRHRSALLKPYG